MDPFAVSPEDVGDLRVVLARGATWSGVLVDDRGSALPDVVVEMRYGDQWRLRRATRTDADGRWRLEDLSPGKAVLLARAYDLDARARDEVVVDGDDLDQRLVAEPLGVARPAGVLGVLGMELVDVDPSLRAAFDVPDYIHVLIWRPGDDVARLGIGEPRRGFGLMMLGNERVKNVAHAVQLLNRFARPTERAVVSDHRGRIVYSYWDERGVGTNTQHLRLTDADLEDFARLEDRYRSRYPPSEPSQK